MEIVIKELELADAIYESQMNNLLEIEEIEDRYMTETSEEKGENFFQKVIRVFKEFIANIINNIKTFFAKKKCKKAVNDFKKMNEKDFEKAIMTKKVSGLINTKILKKAHQGVVKDCAKLAEKIHNAKSIDELSKLEKEIDNLGKGYNIAYLGTKRIDRNFFESEESGTLTPSEVKEITSYIKTEFGNCNDIEDVQKRAEQVMQQLNKVYDIENRATNKQVKEFNKVADKAVKSLASEKQSLIKKLTSKVSLASKKTANFLSKHKLAIMSIITVGLYSYDAGKASGISRGYFSGFKAGESLGEWKANAMNALNE